MKERFPVVYTTHRPLPTHFHPTLASGTKQANSVCSVAVGRRVKERGGVVETGRLPVISPLPPRVRGLVGQI